MLLHKRFQNSGFGTSNNHLFFVRKIEWILKITELLLSQKKILNNIAKFKE